MNNLVKQLGGLVVQKYLEKPSLVKNKKYDVRYFMLIACTKPYLVMTHSGYARLSIEDYTTENFGDGTKSEKTTHLTNAAVQKAHPKFKEVKEDTIMDLNQLADYFIEQ